MSPAPAAPSSSEGGGAANRYPFAPRDAWGIPQAPPELERRSTGRMITGIVITSVGTVLVGTSVPFFVEGAGCNGDFCGYYFAFGAAFALTGIIHLAVGIPLWVSGAAQVPARQSKAAPRIGLSSSGIALQF